jgi:hypothetical protein
MRYTDLLRKLQYEPFQPFRIRMTNGSAIDVLEPGSIIVGKTSAVVPVELSTDDKGYRIAKNWKTIAIAHIVEFVDLALKDSRRKRA